MTDQVRGPGLQPERTALAWRRLALVFLGAGIVLPRVLWHVAGPWSFVGSGLLVVVAVVLHTAGERRYGRGSRAPVGNDHLSDARLLAVTSWTAVLLGVVGLVVVLFDT